MVELIPGTALPLHTGPGGYQPEGRGEVHTTGERLPVSLFERLSGMDGLTPEELSFVLASVRAFDAQPRKTKTIYDGASGNCDATTGNVVIPLFVCPTGCEAHVTQVTVDAPGSSTITPAAPFANASSFMYLAVSGRTTGDTTAANADNYRPALAAFAPISAAGPIIPGQWTFQGDEAPVLFGGNELSYVLHGGSIAALLSLTLRVRYRICLYGAEQ